jgi:hypothetical protein
MAPPVYASQSENVQEKTDIEASVLEIYTAPPYLVERQPTY